MKNIIFYLLLLVLFSVLFISPVKDDLFFSHLSIGESIGKTATGITDEKISFLKAGQFWVNHYWLYDLCLYVGFLVWGIAGYFVLPGFLWGASFAVLGRIKWSLFFLLTLAIYPALFMLGHTPLFVLMPLALYVVTKDTKSLPWFVIPLQIVWTNSHPSFVFFPFVVFLYLWRKKEMPAAVNMFLIAMLSSLVNPYGYEIWLSSFSLFFATSAINLWLWPGYGVIVMMTLFVIYKERKVFGSFEALFLFSVVASILLFDWTIAVVFIAGKILWQQQSLWQRKAFQQVCTVAFSLLVIAHIYISVTSFKVPGNHDISEIIAKDVKIYNDASIGGILHWQNKQLVFADTRKIYSKTVDEILLSIRYDPESFRDIANRYDLNLAVFDYGLPYSKNICVWLNENPEWALVYCNDKICAFAKNFPGNAEIISTHKIENGDIPNKNYSDREWYKIAKFYFVINYVESGKKILNQLETTGLDKHRLQVLKAYDEMYEGNLEKTCGYLEESILHVNELEILQLLISNYLHLHTIQSRNSAYKWILYGNSLYPGDPEIDIYKTQIYHFKEDYVSALSTLRNIIKRHPHYKVAQKYYENIKQNQVEIGSQEKNLQFAKLLYAKGQYQQALKKLQIVLSINSDFVEAHLECGKIYHKLQQYDIAKQHYEYALKIIPNNKEAISYLAITLAVTGNWQEAKKILDPIASEEISYIQGAVSVVNDIVIKMLEKQIQKSPQDVSLRVRICKILAQERRYSEAISYFKDIADPEPVFLSSLYYEYGKEVLNEKKVKEGLALLHQAVKVSKNAEAYLLIGTIELKRKNWSEAEKYYEEVLRVTPSDIRAKEGLALIEQGKGIDLQVQRKYKEAIEQFNKFIAKSSDYEEKKKIEQRIKDMKITLDRLQFLDLKNLYDAGENAIRMKNWDKAITIYNKIIKSFSESPQGYYGLAIAYTNKQDYDKAVENLHTALSHQNHFPEAHDFLSGLYFKMGENEKALHHMELYNEQKNKE